jgi:hypothetical protein
LGKSASPSASAISNQGEKYVNNYGLSVALPAGRGVKVEATCLIAREIDAPAGVDPIEWRLLTNRSATTSDEVIELINWYRARWGIEIFFHVLKNACKVEAMQLSHIDNGASPT